MATNAWIMDYPQRSFIMQPGASVALNTLTKVQPDSVVLYADFGNMAEIVAGQTIASVTTVACSPSDGATPLTITGKAVDTLGYRALANFAAGVAGVSYTITWTVVLSGGSTLVRTGTLNVV